MSADDPMRRPKVADPDVAAAIILLRQMADERDRPDGPVARQARRIADRLDERGER